MGINAEDMEEPVEVLPDFAYRAVDSSGIVENEICPVFITQLQSDAEFEPNPAEVDSMVWVEVDKVIAAVDAAPGVFSPWMVEELAWAELKDALRV